MNSPLGFCALANSAFEMLPSFNGDVVSVWSVKSMPPGTPVFMCRRWCLFAATCQSSALLMGVPWVQGMGLFAESVASQLLLPAGTNLVSMEFLSALAFGKQWNSGTCLQAPRVSKFLLIDFHLVFSGPFEASSMSSFSFMRNLQCFAPNVFARGAGLPCCRILNFNDSLISWFSIVFVLDSGQWVAWWHLAKPSDPLLDFLLLLLFLLDDFREGSFAVVEFSVATVSSSFAESSLLNANDLHLVDRVDLLRLGGGRCSCCFAGCFFICSRIFGFNIVAASPQRCPQHVLRGCTSCVAPPSMCTSSIHQAFA